MSKLGEMLLLALSRRPESDDYREVGTDWTLENALQDLCAVFPDFLEQIRGKSVLDFGCGNGWQSVAMALQGAERVVGLDINPATLQRAKRLAGRYGLEERVEFKSVLAEQVREKFDVVISQNSMEHFPDPESALNEMRAAARPGGKVMITFGAPWFSPWGSHMQFFTRVPWVNLLFSEKTVMNVRAHFRNDAARRYTEVESGLNKMTVSKFERLVARSGLEVEYRLYEGVRHLHFLPRIPVARELFTNRISCILDNPVVDGVAVASSATG
jgi:SAM-dependent methyltransferase